MEEKEFFGLLFQRWSLKKWRCRCIRKPKPKAKNLYLQLWHSKGKKQKLSKPMTSQRLPPIAVTSSWKTALSPQTAPPTGEMCANVRAVKALLIPITTFYYFLRKNVLFFKINLPLLYPRLCIPVLTGTASEHRVSEVKSLLFIHCDLRW